MSEHRNGFRHKVQRHAAVSNCSSIESKFLPQIRVKIHENVYISIYIAFTRPIFILWMKQKQRVVHDPMIDGASVRDVRFFLIPYLVTLRSIEEQLCSFLTAVLHSVQQRIAVGVDCRRVLTLFNEREHFLVRIDFVSAPTYTGWKDFEAYGVHQRLK